MTWHGPDAGRPAALPPGATTYLPLRNVHDAALVESLLGDYGQTLSLAAIAVTVNRCRLELTDPTAGARPELLERLARQRIESGVAAPAVADPVIRAG